MHLLLTGHAASRGQALGRARVRQPHVLVIDEARIAPDDVPAELSRFHDAVAIVRAEMQALRYRLQDALAQDVGDFFDLHALLLDDPELLQGIESLIETEYYSADYALRLQRDRIAAIFESMDDAYLRSRIDDIDQVIGRLHAALHNYEALILGTSGDILVADNVSPTELPQLQEQGVIGIITSAGSPLSHSAILARSLHLPLIVGATDALQYINDGDVLVMDGTTGQIILEPNVKDLRAHQARVKKANQERRQLNQLRREPTRTLDDMEIKLWANAESAHDVSEAHGIGAVGIGLYRTEFLFLGSEQAPDEVVQFRAYRDAVIAMTGRCTTIRTLDLGADKMDSHGLTQRNEPNPALGLRGIRLSLAQHSLLETQLRAIARASAYGKVRILLPMITSSEEMHTVRTTLEQILDALRKEGLEVAKHIPLGAMIEVPSAALSLSTFIHQCDFLSIGTNDLVQYLLATDRTNEALSTLYSPLHPAVLRVLHELVRISKQHQTPLTVCGEIAADPVFVPLLLALGLQELSLHPDTLLEVRHSIRQYHWGKLQKARPALLRAQDRAEIEYWLSQHSLRMH